MASNCPKRKHAMSLNHTWQQRVTRGQSTGERAGKDCFAVLRAFQQRERTAMKGKRPKTDSD